MIGLSGTGLLVRTAAEGRGAPEPWPEQRRALAIAASHLGRAGTETATRLPPEERTLRDQAALLADRGDSTTSAAALCGTLTGALDGWPGGGTAGGPDAAYARATAGPL